MVPIPSSLRSLAPERVRDDVRLRALAVGLGLIPPRTMHSSEDAGVLLRAAKGARRVVEVGVYEGSSALLLLAALGPGCELHLIDPFGRRPAALPSGWGATEWATRRLVEHRARRMGGSGPRVCWHPALSHEVAAIWTGAVDMVFIDGDHSERGCELDWSCWSPFVSVGGHVVFHDARAGRPGGRGLPGPTAVVERHFRECSETGWEIAEEADRTVALRRLS
jgi:predicted O-methyltransferase YrrM